MMKHEDFIVTYENAIPKELCEYIIEEFEKSPCKSEGLAGTVDGQVEDAIKKSTEIVVGECPGFGEIDYTIFGYVADYAKKYINKINEYCDSALTLSNKFSDTGYLIKRYDKGDGWFHWHHDLCVEQQNGYRTVAIIIYLNDVEEGGETEFLSELKIKPKTGTMLFFPASWQYVHRGSIPKSNTKYVITSFLYQQSATY